MSDSNERGSGDGQDVEKKVSNEAIKPEEVSSSSQKDNKSNEDDGKEKVDTEKVEKSDDDDDDDNKVGKGRTWTPNQKLVDTLLNMGFDRIKVLCALYSTGNNSAEAAISWIFENGDSETSNIDFNIEDCGGYTFDDYKMVFVVNCSLNMGVGKACAQVAHAALGLQAFLLENNKIYEKEFTKWIEEGETKIVLKGNNADHLCLLAATATSLKLPNYLVKDAGRTQIPAGSTTVLAIFGRVDMVDQVTRQLKLL